MKKTLLLLGTLVLALALALGAAAETVIYENDFSDPATLADFTQYRAAWEIRDGGLYLTESDAKPTFAHIILNMPAGFPSDYIVEADYMNLQTSGGIIFRADGDSCSDATDNAFYGYLGFVGNDGNIGALGCGGTDGGWKGNINVSPAGVCSVSDNVHIKAIVKGEMIKLIFSNVDTGAELYSYTYKIGTSASDAKWVEGTVGFRMRGEYAKNSVVSYGQAYFDNLKVTTADDVTLTEADATPAAPADAVSFTPIIETAYLEPLYKNTFDNNDAISDFTAYRGSWNTYDGKLYLASQETGAYSFLLYDGDKGLTELTDYVMDVDVYNIQASGGPIIRADLSKADDSTDTSFAGYLGFISSDGTKLAVGYFDETENKWINAKVSGALLTSGSDIHMQMAVKGSKIQMIVTDLKTGNLIYGWGGDKKNFEKGTFGFRMYGKTTSAGLSSLNATGFDNLVISAYGEAPKTTTTTVKLTIGDMNGSVNGLVKKLDAAPIIRNSRTMLPVRFVAEAFGAQVGWDGATSTATITAEGVDIRIQIGAATAQINGETVTLDSPAFIENSRTYLPVRVVAEALGADVAWDGATSTATLTKTVVEAK